MSRLLPSNRSSDGRRAGAGGPWALALAAPLVVLAGCATVGRPGPITTGAITADQGTAGQVTTGDSGAAERQILVTLEELRPAPLRRPGSSSRGYVEPPGYAVSERIRRTANRLAREYDLAQREGWPIRPLGIYCVVYEVRDEVAVEDVIARLSRDARVESVQPMLSFAVESSYDDPYVGMQHGMEATRVWDSHAWAAGRGVTVAVVDTAVDDEHPDLAHNIVLSRDFVKGESVKGGAPGRRAAELHGTAVAGVIGSAANNGIGTVGVAPRARILALRACWEPPGRDPPRDSPGTSSGTCNSFTLAKALAFVVERRPQVVNLSVAGPRDPLLERLIRLAIDRGVAVVTAYRRSAGAVAFPGSMSGVVAVAGPDTPLGDEVVPPLVAPARDILTTTPGGGFDFVSGSSFAAAHVSGVLALLLEKAPGTAVHTLGEVLRRTSRPASGGSGIAAPLVDACAALDQVATAGRCARGATTRSAGLGRTPAPVQ